MLLHAPHMVELAVAPIPSPAGHQQLEDSMKLLVRILHDLRSVQDLLQGRTHVASVQKQRGSAAEP